MAHNSLGVATQHSGEALEDSTDAMLLIADEDDFTEEDDDGADDEDGEVDTDENDDAGTQQDRVVMRRGKPSCELTRRAR